MKNKFIRRQFHVIMLLLFITPCIGQPVENMFHGAIRDKAGNLWFATTLAGLYRYDAVSDRFTNFTMKDGLPTNNISSVFEDKAGNLWINTDKGVCRYKASQPDAEGKFISTFSKNESGCPYDIGLLAEDRKGNLWFGTNGYGICRYTPNPSAHSGLSENDSAGNAFTGVFTNFTKDDGLGSNFIQCILEDIAGNLWVGERAGGVSRYNPATGRFDRVSGACFSSQIMGIIEDRNGNIWFANLYDGLCRYEPNYSGTNGTDSTRQAAGPGKFIHLTEADGLCHNFVTCIYEDTKGNIWFGSDSGKWNTGGGGLCRYDPKKNGTGGSFFTRFTDKDGIRLMNVWTIVEDNDGNIWVGTKGGLYRYHSPSGRFIDYTFKVNSRGN